MSIQEIVAEIFQKNLALVNLKERLYYICFIIIIALDKNAIMFEKTIQTDPDILTKIAQSIPFVTQELITSILLCATKANNIDFFLTQETIKALGASAETIINNLFAIAYENNAYDSLQTLLTNGISTKQLNQTTIKNLFSDVIIDNNYIIPDILLEKEPTYSYLLKNENYKRIFRDAIEKNASNMLSSLIIQPTIAKKLLETTEWINGFKIALENKKALNALLFISFNILKEKGFTDTITAVSENVKKSEKKWEIMLPILQYALKNNIHIVFFKTCLKSNIFNKEELKNLLNKITTIKSDKKNDLKNQIENITK